MKSLRSLHDYVGIKYTITAVLVVIACSCVEFFTIAKASSIISDLFSTNIQIDDNVSSVLFYLMFIFFLKGTFASISNFARSYYSVRVSKSILENYVDATLQNTVLQMQNKDTAAITRDLTVNAASLSSGIVFPILTLISELSMLIGFMIFLYLVLGMIPIYIFTVLIFVIILVNRLINSSLKKLSKRRQPNEKKRVETITDIYSCFSQIKLFGLETDYFKKYFTQIKSLNKIEIIANQLLAFLVTWLEFIVIVVLALAFLTIIPFLEKSYFPKFISLLGENVGFVLFGMRLIPMIGRVSTARAQISFNSAIFAIFINSMEQSVALRSTKINKTYLDLTPAKRISLNQVSVDVGNQNIQYNNLNLNKGQVLLIKGESGSGKTTLLRCLSNLIEPQTGSIDIGFGKMNLKDVEYKNFTNYVDQNAKIFSDTVSFNLTLEQDKSLIDEKRLNYLTETLKIREAIENKVDNLFQYITPNDNKFSGGELQRILLVRALYQDRFFTLFDEPTSALNNEIAGIAAAEIHRFSRDKFVVISTHTNHFDEIATSIVRV